MWRVRRPAGGPVTGTGSLRGSSFRLPYKRTTASSRLTSLRPPSPSRHPRSPSRSFLRPSTLRFASLSVRPRARLRACFSLISRSSDRPFLYPSSSHRHHPPCLLSSFARKRCHTRETAHRLFIPALLPSAAPTRRSSLSRSRIVLPLAFNSRRFVSPPRYPLSPSFSPRKAEVMRRISLLHSSSSSSSATATHRLFRRRSFLPLCTIRSPFSNRTDNTHEWTCNYLSHATTWAVCG